MNLVKILDIILTDKKNLIMDTKKLFIVLCELSYKIYFIMFCDGSAWMGLIYYITVVYSLLYLN